MKEEIIWALCPDCRKRRKHDVKEEVFKQGTVKQDEDEPDTYITIEEYFYQIIECRGCETVSYRQYIRVKEEHEERFISEKLYPIRDNSSIEFKDFGVKIPEKIKILYKEVIETYNLKLGVLCASGIRAVIEGVCNEKGIKGGNVIERDKEGKDKTNKDGTPKFRKSINLDGKIEGLADKGYITKNYATILHDLRFMGNKAVHELNKPTEEQLKIAIDIVENTLSNIYELEFKAARLSQ